MEHPGRLAVAVEALVGRLALGVAVALEATQNNHLSVLWTESRKHTPVARMSTAGGVVVAPADFRQTARVRFQAQAGLGFSAWAVAAVVAAVLFFQKASGLWAVAMAALEPPMVRMPAESAVAAAALESVRRTSAAAVGAQAFAASFGLNKGWQCNTQS